MSSLVSFDQKGVFGPAMTLIYNSQYFNAKGIEELTNVLKENFMKLAHIKPKGRKEFCAFVVSKGSSTPADIVGTRFFQNMQKPELSAHHQKVLKTIVPCMLKVAHEQIPQVSTDSQQVNEWTARFLEAYMTEEQIEKKCQLKQADNEEIFGERLKIGKELYQAASAKRLSESDLDSLIDISQVALERLQKADHFAFTLNFTGRYLTLFSMNEENPSLLGDDVLRSLSTVFKEKFFPREEHLKRFDQELPERLKKEFSERNVLIRSRRKLEEFTTEDFDTAISIIKTGSLRAALHLICQNKNIKISNKDSLNVFEIIAKDSHINGPTSFEDYSFYYSICNIGFPDVADVIAENRMPKAKSAGLEYCYLIDQMVDLEANKDAENDPIVPKDYWIRKDYKDLVRQITLIELQDRRNRLISTAGNH